MADGVEDPYPSLSDFHDYEPNLEFDDSDLLDAQHPEIEEGKQPYLGTLFKSKGRCYQDKAYICTIIFKLVTNFEEEPDAEFLESPMADGTIEEDFEAALARGRGGADAMNDRGDASSGMLRNGPENDQKSIQPLDFSGKPI